MKKTLLDFFKKTYDAKVCVSARDRLCGKTDQLRGLAAALDDGRDIFRDGGDNAAEEIYALIRELRPKILRLYPADSNYRAWLNFCRREEICPHIVLRAADPAQTLRGTVSELREQFAGDEIWTPRRFYELDCDPLTASRGSDEEIAARAVLLNEAAAVIREADPEGEIILTGLMPYGENSGRAELWNTRMMKACAGNMNAIGVAWQPLPVAGRTPEEGTDGIELMYALSEEFRDSMARLERQIRASGAENVRVVLSGWQGLDDGVPQKRQDCVYYTAVYEAIRAMSDLIAAAEYGPLFGTAGLFSEEDGIVFGNVSYQNLLLTTSELEIPLQVKEFSHEKPIPAEHWAGVPGSLDGREMKWVQVSASRSADGKSLHLLMTNRHPFKRAVLRVRFYDMPDLYPIEASILRSAKPTDGNSAAEPMKVYCKQIKLREYRAMDHVNPDISEASSVSMLLTVKAKK